MKREREAEKRMKSGRTGKAGLAAIVLGVGLLAAAGCATTDSTVQAEAEQAIPVQVETVKSGSLAVNEPFYGTVTPAREVLVVPKLGGTLEKLHVAWNERVEKGQRLAVIEHEHLDIQMRLQELAAEQALDQYRNLKASGASQQQLDQAMRGVEQARLNLRLAELNLDNAFVTAPISGRITEVNGEEGDLVSSASPLFRITADERMTVTVSVSARQRMLLEKQDAIRVVIPDLDLAVTAKLTKVSSVPTGGFYTVEAELDNRDGTIVPGMSARFELEHVLVEEALLVPTSALVEKSGETSVFVVSGDRVAEVKVDVLETQTDLAAVAGELSAGDRVVTKGQMIVQDGALVQIVGEGQ